MPAAMADLEFTLEGRPAPPAAAPARPTGAKKQTARKPKPAVARAAQARANSGPAVQELASRSTRSPFVIARRGHAPVLPPVDGSAVIPLSAPPVAAPAPTAIEVNARLGQMLAESTDAYRMPDPRTPRVGVLKRGQQVAIVSQWQGWFAVVMGDGSQAYVPQTHVEVLPYAVKTVSPTAPPIPAPAAVPTPAVSPAATAAVLPYTVPARFAGQFEAAPTPLARMVLEEAFRYYGTPYVYGGNTENGIDCSGFVKNCFATGGVPLPRRASEQVEVGQAVPLEQLLPGDRLYFSVSKAYDHTGIYLGNGFFIHASSSRRKVEVDHLSTPLYRKNLAAARRS